MRIVGASKLALAALLMGGSLGTLPMTASADTNASQNEEIQTTNDKNNSINDVKVTVNDNGDGTKTIAVTIPKDDIVKNNTSLENSSFNIKSSDDSQNQKNVEAGSGNVEVVKDGNAKLNINLSQSALSNETLMNEPLTIKISDNQGNVIGTISNVTFNELTKIANQQKDQQKSQGTQSTESSSTSSTSPSNSDNSGTTSDSSASVSSNGNDEANKSDNSSSQTASQKQNNFNSVEELVKAIKANGAGAEKGATVVVKSPSNVETNDSGTSFDGGSGTLFTSKDKHTDIKAGQPVQVTIDTIDDTLSGDSKNGNYDYVIQYSNPKAQNKTDDNNGTASNSNGNNGGSDNGSGQANPQGGQNSGGNSGASDNNSELPQTSDDKQATVKAGVGVFGLLSSLLAAVQLKRKEH